MTVNTHILMTMHTQIDMIINTSNTIHFTTHVSFTMCLQTYVNRHTYDDDETDDNDAFNNADFNEYYDGFNDCDRDDDVENHGCVN